MTVAANCGSNELNRSVTMRLLRPATTSSLDSRLEIALDSTRLSASATPSGEEGEGKIFDRSHDSPRRAHTTGLSARRLNHAVPSSEPPNSGWSHRSSLSIVIRARVRLLNMSRWVVWTLTPNCARSSITCWNVTTFGSRGSISNRAVAR